MPAFNAVLLGTLLYRSRLVPRIIPTVGLIGAPLPFAAMLATLFGAIDQVSAVSAILTFLIAAWELSIGLWMTFKGFDRQAVAARSRLFGALSWQRSCRGARTPVHGSAAARHT